MAEHPLKIFEKVDLELLKLVRQTNNFALADGALCLCRNSGIGERDNIGVFSYDAKAGFLRKGGGGSFARKGGAFRIGPAGGYTYSYNNRGRPGVSFYV